MSVTVDFRELDEFKKNMQITTEQYNNFLSDFLIERGEEVVAETKLNTPVDTGALRASWGIDTNKMIPREVELASTKTGEMVQKTMFEREGKISKKGSGKNVSITISNPQEYASDIEYGFTKPNGESYAGRLMHKKALDKVKALTPKMYNIKFEDFKRRMNLA